MSTRLMGRVLAVTTLAVAAGALASGRSVAGAAQGSGNPTLTVAPTALAPDRPTTVTVRGSDYLVPPHAAGASVFGGVYVFFGWVRPGDSWGPSHKTSVSNDGTFGTTYHHAGDGGDGSTRDDGTGRMRLVSFTAGGESGNATPYHMDDVGNWTTTLTVRGPTYVYRDPATGADRTVDCRTVQCGVFTIGAHGKSSRTNERFTPVLFTTPVTGPGPSTPTAPAAPTAPRGSAPARGAAAPGGAPAASTAPADATSTTTGPAAGTALPDTGGPGADGASGRGRDASGPTATPARGDTRTVASADLPDSSDGVRPWIVWALIVAILGATLWGLRRWAT